MTDIAQRITDYLASGGLFNPEQADHDAVRDLLIDCRAELAEARKDAERLSFIEANKDRTLRHHKRYWSFVGLTNYEFKVHKTLREAIDAAMRPA